MEQKMQEKEEAKAEFMSSQLNAEQTGEGEEEKTFKQKKLLTYFTPENESIMKINQFLETSLKEGKISNSLYNHIKSN